VEYGLLLLRAAVAVSAAADARTRLGAPGARRMAELGYRAPAAMALLAAAAQVVGGALLLAGFLTPLGALAVAVVALNRVALGRRREAPLLVVGIAVALGMTGPGRLSVDRALDWDDGISGLAWGAGMLGVAAAITFFLITLGRARAESAEIPA
jgi:putative oxidoreductase